MLHHWISERKFSVLTLTFNLLHLRSKKFKVLMTSLVQPQIYKKYTFLSNGPAFIAGFWLQVVWFLWSHWHYRKELSLCFVHRIYVSV